MLRMMASQVIAMKQQRSELLPYFIPLLYSFSEPPGPRPPMRGINYVCRIGQMCDLNVLLLLRERRFFSCRSDTERMARLLQTSTIRRQKPSFRTPSAATSQPTSRSLPKNKYTSTWLMHRREEQKTKEGKLALWCVMSCCSHDLLYSSTGNGGRSALHLSVMWMSRLHVSASISHLLFVFSSLIYANICTIQIHLHLQPWVTHLLPPHNYSKPSMHATGKQSLNKSNQIHLSPRLNQMAFCLFMPYAMPLSGLLSNSLRCC